MQTSQFADAQSVMRRALEIASQKRGSVEPNPPVGAIIVDERLNLIAEGRHEQFGGPHAEVHALTAANEKAAGQTLFVTLEPCSHHGKTPPCTQAVIEAGISKVVVAMSDPSPHTAGAGIQQLRDAGIDVEVGLLEVEARRLTAPFLKLLESHLPYVHAKWAMTLDGKLASRSGHSQWISSPESRSLVHTLRGRMDAVIVGSGTVQADDPLMTARPPGPRVATRIVIDSAAKLSLASNLMKTVNAAPVLVAAGTNAEASQLDKLRSSGAEVLQFEPAATGGILLRPILEELGRRQFTNVLIEGGASLFGSFFDERLVDEVHAFIAPKIVGGQAAASPIGGRGLEYIPNLPSLQDPQIEIVGSDVYIHGPLVSG